MAQEKNNKPNSGLYVAAFFVIVILIIILFFVKKDDIVSNLKRTNFFERVGVSTPEFVEKHPIKEDSVPEDIEIDLFEDKTNSEEKLESAEVLQEPDITNETDKTLKKEETSSLSKTETKKAAENQKVVQKATRTATLYFVSIGADGSVNRMAVKRELSKSDSPLTDAIKALLAGPVPSEKNAMSLIPSGSKLIGASVKDGVATLNFNESFSFNSYGVEGSIAQLMQIVYTATEFSTVKSVQFLIEGEKKEYLGSEGQWIGSPLARNSF